MIQSQWDFDRHWIRLNHLSRIIILQITSHRELFLFLLHKIEAEINKKVRIYMFNINNKLFHSLLDEINKNDL